MNRLAALALAIPWLCVQTVHAQTRSVRAVRHWELGDVTRVAVEVSGGFQFHTDRLHNPERVYFDILHARPWINSRRGFTETVTDKLLKRIRVAETTPGITRVVLDLADGVETTTSELVNPNRLIVELHSPAAVPATPLGIPVMPQAKPPVLPTLPPPKPPALPATPLPKPPVTAAAEPPPFVEPPPSIALSGSAVLAKLEPAKVDGTKPFDASLDAQVPSPPPALPTPNGPGRPAHRTSAGENSLVRALGLKINRIVIDPGHGGPDEGTMGPKGLLEKDLVLDVALRLGKLIQQRMGSEVIFTRSDDTFIPLQGRTELANAKKADLFLSIHANSSPAQGVTGIETYYLNFTDSRDALDVAARENSGSAMSVFELHELVQKITLHDKAEESREFASRVQSSLQALSSRNFPGEKNRGVRKAPFVVLIGANMPSVLAEIGFLSNSKEESLLRKADYRQKLAEALFRGVSRYAESLSHFQVAKN